MSKNDISNNLNYVMSFFLFIIIVVLFTRYIHKQNLVNEISKINKNKSDPEKEMDLVKHYMLNESKDEKELKPIIWIHVPYELNSRSWESFNGRMSNDLNLPYIYLCIKNIVNKCGNNFHIVIIDDNSFNKLLEGNWKYNLSSVGSPLKEKIRYLGLVKVLHKYGGILLPKSFLALKNLMPFYIEGTKDNKPFVCERVNQTKFTCDSNFIGCLKECNVMEKYINFLNSCTNKYTDESNFLKENDKWIFDNIKDFNSICGSKIGVKDKDKNPIKIEHLFGEKYLKLPNYVFGLNLPEKQINTRSAFNWFSYLPENEIVKGNSILSKYFLMAQQM